MARMSIADEAAVVALLKPSAGELAAAAKAIDEVLAGIKREGSGWRVDPSLAPVVRGRCPGTLVRAAQHGREVLVAAQAMLGRAGGLVGQEAR
jgi:hypothetical protein